MSLEMNELEEPLLLENGLGTESSTDASVSSERVRKRVGLCLAALVVVGAVIGVVAATGGFSGTPGFEDPNAPSSYAVARSFQAVQKNCATSCTLSHAAFGLSADSGETFTHLNHSLGDVELMGGEFSTYTSAAVGGTTAGRRRRDSATIPVLHYHGVAKARNLTFIASMLSWYEPEQGDFRLAMKLQPDPASRPTWAHSEADLGVVQQLVGLPGVAPLPVAVQHTTVGYVSHNISGEATPDFEQTEFRGALPPRSGVSINSTSPADSLMHIDDILSATGNEPSKVNVPVSGTVHPVLDLTAAVPPHVDMRLGHIKLENVKVHINKTRGADGTVQRFLSASATIALPGQPPINVDIEANVTGTEALHAIGHAAPGSTLPLGATTGSGPGLELEGLTLTLDIDSPSVWNCDHDYTDQCPHGWVASNATACVDPEWLTCSNLTMFGSVPPPQLQADERLTHCDEVQCDCACLVQQPWPGVNNATADAWRKQACPAHVPGASDRCSGIINVPTVADRQAFFATCPEAPWPCRRSVSASLDASLNLYGAAQIAVNVAFDTTNDDEDHVDLDFRNVKLTKTGSVTLQHGTVDISAASVAVSASVAVAAHGSRPMAIAGASITADKTSITVDAEGQEIPLSAGLTLTDTTLDLTIARRDHTGGEVSDSDVSVSLDGKLALKQWTFDAKAQFSTTQGVTLLDLSLVQGQTAPATLGDAVDALCGGTASCAYDNAPMPSATAAALKPLQLQGLEIVYRNTLPSVNFEASVVLDGVAFGLEVLFVPKAPAASWDDLDVAVKLTAAKAFALDSLVPGATSPFASTANDGSTPTPTPFLSGGLIVSTFDQSATGFPATWYSGLDAAVASPGTSLAASLPVAALDHLGFPKDVWTAGQRIIADAAFGKTTVPSDVEFKIVLPPNGRLAKGVVLAKGVLDVNTKGPSTLEGELALTFGGDAHAASNVLDVDVTGTLDDGLVTVHGSVPKPWTIRSGVTMANADVTFAVGPHTPAHGSVSGQVDIHGATVTGSLDLPSLKASLEVAVPHLQLAKGIVLNDVDVKASTTSGIDASGTLVVDVPHHEPLTVAADVSFANGGYALTATMDSWAIDGAVTLKDVHVDVQGAVGGALKAATLAGSLVTDIGTVAVTTKLPFDGPDGEFKVDFTNWHLGSDVTLTSGSVSVVEAGVTLAAVAAVQLGASSSLSFDGTGTFSTYGGVTFHGTLGSDWHLSGDRLLATSVTLDLLVNHSKTTGRISGDIDFAGTKVDMDMTIPLKHGMAEIDIPTLRLDSRVVLHNVQAEFNDQGTTPVVTFSGTCDIATGASSSSSSPPISIAVTGSSTSQAFSFTGSLQSWTVHVGKDNIVLEDLSLHVEKATSGAVSGSITAKTTFAGYDCDAAVYVPTPDHTKGLEIKLQLADGSSTGSTPAAVTPHAVVSASSDAPSASGSATSSGVGSPVMTAHLEDLDMTIITEPALINVTGRASVFDGDQLVVMTLIQETEAAAAAPTTPPAASTPSPAPTTSWGFSVSVTLTKPFELRTVVPSASTWFSQFSFSAGGLRLADPPAAPTAADLAAQPVWAAVPAGIAAVDNVVVLGELAFEALSSKMGAASLWSSVPGHEQLVAWAAFGFGQPGEDLALNVTLPDNLPLGAHFTINNGTVEVQSQEPHFDLRTVATAQLGDLSPITFECDIEETATDFEIKSGYVDNTRLKVGPRGIVATAVVLDAKVVKSTMAFSGSLTGTVSLAEITWSLEISYPVADHGLRIELQAHPTLSQKLTLSNVIGALHPSAAGSLPSFGNVFGHPVFDLSASIDTSPVAFTLQAFAEGLFDIQERLSLKLQFTDRRSDWIWAVGVGIGQPFKLSDLSSDWHLLSSLSPIDQGGVILSSYPQEFVIPGSPEVMAIEGVTIFGNWPMDGHLSEIAKRTGVESLMVKGTYGFESHRFSLRGTIDTDWHIGDDFYFNNASVFVDFPGTKGQGAFDFGISADFSVRVGKPSLPHNMLTFTTALMIGEAGFTLDGSLDTPWVDPFGVHGLTIQDTEVEVGFSWELVPFLVGLSGGLDIGKESGSATIFVDAAEPEDFIVAGTLSKFSLAEIVEALTFNAIPPKIADEVFDVTFEDVALSLNLDPETQIFNHHVYRPGFNFSVAEFQLWFLKGSADVQIDVDVVYVHVDVEPFSLADGVVKIGGMTEAGQMTNTPLDLTISLGPHMVQDYFELSADGKFLDILDVGAYLDISATNGFQVALKFELEPFFDFFFNLSLTKTPDDGDLDFSLYADLGLELPQKVSDAIIKFLDGVKSAADSKIDEAKSALGRWQADNGDKVQSLTTKINADEAAIGEAKSAHEASIRAHIKSLDSYQGTLNSYNSQKEGYERGKRSCHWYDVGCDAHNAWEDTKIAWVDAKILFYKAKVAVETDALKALGWVEGAAYDVDEALNPKIDALRVERAALATLEAAEDGLKHALSVAEDGINDIIKALIDFTGAIFGLESLIASASSVSGLAHGEKVMLAVKGQFLGKPYEWKIDFVFPPSFDNIVKSLWSTIKSDLHL